MSVLDSLLEQGYTPKGGPRKTINMEGKPEYRDTSPMGTVARGLMLYMQSQQKEMERKQKEDKRKADMYQTLRDAGYDPKSAFDAVEQGGMPAGPGGETLKEKRETRLGGGTTKGLSESARFREDIKNFRAGITTYEDLEEKYPDKIDTLQKIRKQVTPKVEKSAKFKAGTGGAISNLKSFFSKDQAELNDVTRKVIANIKTEGDLAELLKDAELYESEGVDIKAIKEYFGRE